MNRHLDRRVYSDVVRSAVDAAARQANNMRSIDTRDVLVALMNADMIGQWDRIWLDFATPEAIGWAPVADPRAEPIQFWGDAPLTATCASALSTAVRFAEHFESETVSVGMVVLGLIADPTTAAATALTAGNRDRHPALITAIQEAIIGVNLGPLPLVQAAGTTPQRRQLRRRLLPATGTEAAPLLDDWAGRTGFDVLVAAMGNLEDPELALRFRRLLLDAQALESVRPLVANLSCPTAEEVVNQARDRFDVKKSDEPHTRQLVVAATWRPGQQIAEALRLLGVSAAAVAFEAADADARHQPKDDPTGKNVAVWSLANALASVAASYLIAHYAWTTHHWWTLAFIWFVWTGHPLISLALTGVLWWATDSTAGLGMAAVTVLDIAWLRASRRAALFRTGMALTIGQWRTHEQLRKAAQARLVTALVRWKRMRRLPEDLMVGGGS